MPLNYRKIEEQLNETRRTKSELIEAIGLSRGGFYNMIEKKSMKVDTLVKMSKFFGVPVSYWFEEDESLVHDPGATYKLKQRIEELEDDKELLKSTIEFLQEKFGGEHAKKKDTG